MRIMGIKPKFLTWIMPFAAFGLFVPTVITAGWFLFHPNFGEWLVLWPSSIMFMALDTPTLAPASTVISVYSLAFIENILLYAAIGIVTWPFAYLAMRVDGFFRRSR
ncbi:MAG: hypothetical protein ACLPM3_13215 [Terracidiphilus sp.]